MVSAAPEKRRRPTKTIDSIVGLKARRPGSFYKLSPGSSSLALEVQQSEPPYVDRAAMSARAIISTAALDRVGDLLVPQGCKLDNYKRNPVVLWAHGFDGIGKPIGKSEDPDGKLAVKVTKDAVEATCFFSQSSLEAEQIFELVAEGIVRATSVRETPITSSWQHDRTLGDLLLVDEWDLEEWSWCAVGVNPEAVAKALDRNRLAGRVIAPSIAKSLSVWCPERAAQGVGFVEERTTMADAATTATMTTKSIDDPAKKPEEDAAKGKKSKKGEKVPEGDAGASANGGGNGSSSEDAAKSAVDAADQVADDLDNPDQGEPVNQNDGEPDGDEGVNTPYGQQVLSATHASLSMAIKGIEAAMGPLENPTVKEGMTTIYDCLKEQMAAVEGLHSSAYPGAKGLVAEGSGDQQEPDGDENDAATLKSFLTLGTNPQYQVLGIASKLKGLSVSKNLTRDQRRILGEMDQHLKRLVSQAKAQKAAASATKASQTTENAGADSEDPAVIAALQKRLDDFLSRLPA